MRTWMRFTLLRNVSDFCEYDNELSGSIKHEVLPNLGKYQFFKKASAPRSFLLYSLNKNNIEYYFILKF